jgi:hypothetical protein
MSLWSSAMLTCYHNTLIIGTQESINIRIIDLNNTLHDLHLTCACNLQTHHNLHPFMEKTFADILKASICLSMKSSHIEGSEIKN